MLTKFTKKQNPLELSLTKSDEIPNLCIELEKWSEIVCTMSTDLELNSVAALLVSY